VYRFNGFLNSRCRGVLNVSPDRASELIAALEQTTAEVSELLESVADDGDWRLSDEHWSFRQIAAHLEACQSECVLVRVRQIAAGAKPRFEFYDNDGWDFSDRDLRHSVREWRESRGRVFDFVRSLSPERLSRTGSHRTFGEITVLDYLRVDLDHDREHLADLNQVLAERARSEAASGDPEP
jgi:hypothetical protein